MSLTTHMRLSFAAVRLITPCLLRFMLFQVFFLDIALRKKKMEDSAKNANLLKNQTTQFLLVPHVRFHAVLFPLVWPKPCRRLLAGDLKSWIAIWISTKALEITIILLGIKLPNARSCLMIWPSCCLTHWCLSLHINAIQLLKQSTEKCVCTNSMGT